MIGLLQCLLFCFMFSQATSEFNRVYEIAETPPRSVVVPMYADVCFCTRWERNSSIPMIEKYHATRMEWCYTTNSAFITACRSAGITSFSCANSACGRYPSGHPNTMKDSEGNGIIAPWMTEWSDRYWGCANRSDHRNYIMNELKACIDAGADCIQFDNSLVNLRSAVSGWGSCYCSECISPVKTPQNQALIQDFYNFLNTNIDVYAGRDVEFSCNNAGATWNYPAAQEVFSYGCGELDPVYGTNVLLMWQRLTQDNYKPQIVSLRSTNAVYQRRLISLAYACGQHALMPYDVYMPNNDPRFFGEYSDYAPITGLVRAVPQYLNEYEEAYAYGPGISDDRYGTEFLPAVTVGGNGQKYLFVRSKVGDSQGAKIIHVVEWEDSAEAYKVKIHIGRLFYSNSLKVKARFFRPKDYEETEHDAAQASGNFSGLKDSWDKTITYDGDYAIVGMDGSDLDVARPWGYLVIEIDE
ncbi:MAG: hypothetical protein AB7E95_11565 [Kiritimatiellales bacterium]